MSSSRYSLRSNSRSRTRSMTSASKSKSMGLVSSPSSSRRSSRSKSRSASKSPSRSKKAASSSFSRLSPSSSSISRSNPSMMSRVSNMIEMDKSPVGQKSMSKSKRNPGFKASMSLGSKSRSRLASVAGVGAVAAASDATMAMEPMQAEEEINQLVEMPTGQAIASEERKSGLDGMMRSMRQSPGSMNQVDRITQEMIRDAEMNRNSMPMPDVWAGESKEIEIATPPRKSRSATMASALGLSRSRSASPSRSPRGSAAAPLSFVSSSRRSSSTTMMRPQTVVSPARMAKAASPVSQQMKASPVKLVPTPGLAAVLNYRKEPKLPAYKLTLRERAIMMVVMEKMKRGERV